MCRRPDRVSALKNEKKKKRQNAYLEHDASKGIDVAATGGFRLGVVVGPEFRSSVRDSSP
jgi:hypothetical protein